MRGGIQGWVPGAIVVVLALALAPAASAAVRYAAHDGDGASGPDQCLEADPCSLQQAVMGTAGSDVVNGDEIVVLPTGPYTVTSQIFASDNITIHGPDGQPRPVLNSGVATAFGTNVGATFRRLQIEHTGTTAALSMFPGSADDLVVHSTSGNACTASSTGNTIRNSVCWTEATGDSAIFIGGGASDTVTLRNVTAVSTGASNTHALRVTNTGGAMSTVTGTNVIAQATNDPPETSLISDVEVSASGAGTNVTVTMDHSNYEDVLVNQTSGGTATLTPNTTNGNQGAIPLFESPSTGDFHQVLGSPTIDAGIVDPANGTTDIDGQPRQMGTSTDIGADEFPDSDSDGIPDSSDGCPNQAGPASNNGCPLPEDQPPNESDTAPPDTAITQGPSGKTKKKTATIAFSGSDTRAVASFQCKLDSGSFEACTSPKTYSGLKKGSHTVEVRAIDGAGNVDPTPASRTWKVKKKKKR
jgi:hypothetical protein